MFDQYGQPTGGYGQMSPFQDLPAQSTPGQPGRPRVQPLQQAIAGNTNALAPGAQASVNPPPHPVSPLNKPEVHSFIQTWQNEHHPSEGIGPLAEALKANGYGVARHMYGDTASDNELNIAGEKFKVLGGEGGPAQYWYKPGMNDGASKGRPSGSNSGLLQMLLGGLGQPQTQQTVSLQPTNSTGGIDPLQAAIKSKVPY